MDVNLLRVMKASAAAQAAAAAQLAKANEEKLVVFFKGEFLAVRNAEGGFYICQVNDNQTAIILYTGQAIIIIILGYAKHLPRRPQNPNSLAFPRRYQK